LRVIFFREGFYVNILKGYRHNVEESLGGTISELMDGKGYGKGRLSTKDYEEDI